MCRAERRRSVTTTILLINSFQIRRNISAAQRAHGLDFGRLESLARVIAGLVPTTPHSGIILA
jgi:hypothetical protein